MSVTLRFQSTGVIPGNARPATMRGPNLTVGRGQGNDLVLPDPDRSVSSSHCVLENHSGTIFVVDLSTNGTFLNYSKVPLGRAPTALNDGDILSIGPYELIVEMSGGVLGADLMAPSEPERASHGRASSAPDPLALLDDAPPGMDFLDSLLGDPKGPKGPRNLKMGSMDHPELLPPLGDDDGPLLGPSKAAPVGPAMRDHSSSASDAFRPAAATRSVIPDDWDDLLAPKGAPPARRHDPFAAPVPPPAVATPAIPDNAFDDLFAPIAKSVAPAPTASPFAEQDDAPSVMIAPPPTQDEPPETAPTAADPFAFVPDPTPIPVPLQSGVAIAQAAAAPAHGGAAVDAVLDALGAADIRLTDAELVLTMRRLGGTLKAMITGLREILMTRTSIKSEFRIDQTMITVGKNNPLKFSISPEQAIEAMTKPAVKGYLEAEQSAQQALDDIKAHEIAMVTGMEAALKGVLARLDPAVLTTRIETGGGLGAMFRGKKAQYWETYEKMYAEIADQAENDFHDLFSREFAQAYKDQLARLKAGQ